MSKLTTLNILTPENNMVAYNFYAQSIMKENVYQCSNLILQYDNENIHIPLSLRKNAIGYFRALWVDQELIGPNFEVVGSWEIQHNPNATVLKIKDNGIPNNPNATIFLPLTKNEGENTYNIGINFQGNISAGPPSSSTTDESAYQATFYQPQNVISNDEKFNSTYVPYIASNAEIHK